MAAAPGKIVDCSPHLKWLRVYGDLHTKKINNKKPKPLVVCLFVGVFVCLFAGWFICLFVCLILVFTCQHFSFSSLLLVAFLPHPMDNEIIICILIIAH